jgi:putative ABC transport system permease protein
MALGASPRQIARFVAARGLLSVGAGVGIGVATALASGRAFDAMLFGITARDLPSLLAAAGLIAAAALMATAGPVRRAVRVDPGLALRPE